MNPARSSPCGCACASSVFVPCDERGGGRPERSTSRSWQPRQGLPHSKLIQTLSSGACIRKRTIFCMRACSRYNIQMDLPQPHSDNPTHRENPIAIGTVPVRCMKMMKRKVELVDRGGSRTNANGTTDTLSSPGGVILYAGPGTGHWSGPACHKLSYFGEAHAHAKAPSGIASRIASAYDALTSQTSRRTRWAHSEPSQPHSLPAQGRAFSRSSPEALVRGARGLSEPKSRTAEARQPVAGPNSTGERWASRGT